MIKALDMFTRISNKMPKQNNNNKYPVHIPFYFIKAETGQKILKNVFKLRMQWYMSVIPVSQETQKLEDSCPLISL
jgi:hypothetical protein